MDKCISSDMHCLHLEWSYDRRISVYCRLCLQFQYDYDRKLSCPDEDPWGQYIVGSVVCAFDTNGTVSSWSSTNTTVSASGNSVSATLEILENKVGTAVSNIVQHI